MSYLEVKQGEVIVAARESPVRHLYTLGLEPCIGFLVTSPGTIALAHLDGNPMRHVLNKILQEIRPERGVQVTIFSSSNMAMTTYKRLETIVWENHHEYSSVNSPDDTVNVMIDVESSRWELQFTRQRHEPPPVVNPAWDLGEQWVRGTGQFPLLKRLTLNAEGELRFQPDPTEQYLARRYFSRSREIVEEDIRYHEAEEEYKEELAAANRSV